MSWGYIYALTILCDRQPLCKRRNILPRKYNFLARAFTEKIVMGCSTGSILEWFEVWHFASFFFWAKNRIIAQGEDSKGIGAFYIFFQLWLKKNNKRLYIKLNEWPDYSWLLKKLPDKTMALIFTLQKGYFKMWGYFAFNLEYFF